MNELSLIELESELSTELPTRNLMRRHKMRYGYHPHSGGTSASANNGSGANGAKQNIYIVPVQIAISNGGDAKNEIEGGINVSQLLGQTNVPTNLALG